MTITGVAGRLAGARGVGGDAAGADRFAGAGPIGVYTTDPDAGVVDCALAPCASANRPGTSTARLTTAWAASNRVRVRLLINAAYSGLGGLACLELGRL